MGWSASYEFGFCEARRVPAHRSNIIKHFAGQVAWTAPGRIGFMSTQRQVAPTPSTKTRRWGPRSLRPAISMSRVSHLEQALSSPITRITHAQVSGRTAPPYQERLATNSLQSDCLTTQLVRLVQLNIRSSSCPPGPAAARQPSSRRFSGHPFRTSPPLLELRVSTRPCRVYPQP